MADMEETPDKCKTLLNQLVPKLLTIWANSPGFMKKNFAAVVLVVDDENILAMCAPAEEVIAKFTNEVAVPMPEAVKADLRGEDPKELPLMYVSHEFTELFKIQNPRLHVVHGKPAGAKPD